MKPGFWISRQTVRLALIVAVPLGVLLAPRALLRAQTALKKWAAGDTLTAKDLNDNFDALRASIPATATNIEFLYAQGGATPVVEQGPYYPQHQWLLNCPAGKRVLGGGCHAGSPEWVLWINAPTWDFKGWECQSENVSNGFTTSQGSPTSYPTYIWAICANVP